MEISEIIDLVDIVEYISQYCDLEKDKSSGEYWGLSPLKEEKTPSFSVDEQKQIFYDFSSGKGGDVLSFIKEYENCNTRKAVGILKKFANITDDGSQQTKRLISTSVAKRFKPIEKKKYSLPTETFPENYMSRFESNEEKLSMWTEEGIPLDILKKHQVKYDPFSNRLVYPIKNTDGDIINVCGRTLDPKFKENKVRKYTYFKSIGSVPTLYGYSDNLCFIKTMKEAIIFEGAKSVMLAEAWGIRNTCALFTSHVSPIQFEILMKAGVPLTFALDAGVNIKNDKNISRLLNYTPVYWVKNRNNTLKDGDSPTDSGRDVFLELYKHKERLN